MRSKKNRSTLSVIQPSQPELTPELVALIVREVAHADELPMPKVQRIVECEGLDWYAGLLVTKACERGVDQSAIARLLIDAARTIDGWASGDSESLLDDAESLLSGKIDVEDTNAHRRVFGTIAFFNEQNSDCYSENAASRVLNAALTIATAHWSDGSFVPPALASAARTLVRNVFGSIADNPVGGPRGERIERAHAAIRRLVGGLVEGLTALPVKPALRVG